MTSPDAGPELTTRDIDAELSVLFEPVTIALAQRRPVVALGLWQSFHAATLLPFHGYLGRTSFHDLFPIHPRFGIITYRPEGERVLSILHGDASDTAPTNQQIIDFLTAAQR